jgi:hypothetical protein
LSSLLIRFLYFPIGATFSAYNATRRAPMRAATMIH